MSDLQVPDGSRSYVVRLGKGDVVDLITKLSRALARHDGVGPIEVGVLFDGGIEIDIDVASGRFARYEDSVSATIQRVNHV